MWPQKQYMNKVYNYKYYEKYYRQNERKLEYEILKLYNNYKHVAIFYKL